MISLKLSRRALMSGTSTLLGASLLGIGPARSSKAATRKITLEVRAVNGRPTYNGLSPGPTIYADPGDILDVHLINRLPRLDDDCTEQPNNFHGRKTTNLHILGLHVSPTTDSSGAFDADNVFVSVTPKDQFVPCSKVCGESVKTTFRDGDAHFRFEIPKDYPTGTFWYHAPKHGSTFHQVGAGLSGPLILRDRPGAMPGIGSIARSGTRWGLGSDGAIVAPYSPFISLAWAVTGKNIGGQEAWGEDQRISREEALIAHTRQNAELIFMEEDLGSLEVGKRADVVVLDQDYLTVPEDQIASLLPVLTMTDGRIAFEE